MSELVVIVNSKSSFEWNDLKILDRNFNVVHVEKPISKMDWLRFFRELRVIKEAKGVFIWFAGWPAYFAMTKARSLNVPLAVVVGGYDVASVPEIGYGATLHLKERMASMRVLRRADFCLPVSVANSVELLEMCKPRQSRIIYNGVDHNRFVPDGEKENIIISVGGVNDKNYRKKGIDKFIEVARSFPKHQFFMVGGYSEDFIGELKAKASKNLDFTGYLDDIALLRLYQKASVYLQPSMHESFGISVVEAMLCGCVPVVSDRYALPEVVGEAGKVFPYGDDKAMVKAVEEAMEVSDKEREGIRKRGEFFTLEKREKELVEVLREMIG